MLPYKMRRVLGFFFTQNYTKEELDQMMVDTLEGYHNNDIDPLMNKSYAWGRVYTAFCLAGLKDGIAKIEADKRFGYEAKTLN